MNNLQLFYYRHNRKKGANFMPDECITFNELTIVLDGQLEYKVNGKNYTVGTGNAIFIKKFQHRQREKNEKTADYVSFNFTGEVDFSYPTLIKNAVTRESLLLIDFCDLTLKNDLPEEKEILTPILKTYLTLIEKQLTVGKEHPLTTTIKNYIRKNLKNKVSLEDISKTTFYSAIYLEKVFKNDTGRSIIDYHLEERITKAKRLLIEGSTSLTEIAESVGFFDYNYFSRIFKQRVGFTPSQYRKAYLKKL
jgi:YesN/AraC family two-component response regulator